MYVKDMCCTGGLVKSHLLCFCAVSSFNSELLVVEINSKFCSYRASNLIQSLSSCYRFLIFSFMGDHYYPVVPFLERQTENLALKSCSLFISSSLVYLFKSYLGFLFLFSNGFYIRKGYRNTCMLESTL